MRRNLGTMETRRKVVPRQLIALLLPTLPIPRPPNPRRILTQGELPLAYGGRYGSYGDQLAWRISSDTGRKGPSSPQQPVWILRPIWPFCFQLPGSSADEPALQQCPAPPTTARGYEYRRLRSFHHRAFPFAIVLLYRQPRNSGFGKLLRPRVTLGPSPGGIHSPPPPNVHLHSSFVSPNRFEPLANVIPEYRQLRYVDVDVKARESSEWMSTRALLDSGGQGSFINDQLFTRYQLPCLVKPTPISLILAD